jgi:hypothetical protein
MIQASDKVGTHLFLWDNLVVFISEQPKLQDIMKNFDPEILVLADQ